MQLLMRKRRADEVLWPLVERQVLSGEAYRNALSSIGAADIRKEAPPLVQPPRGTAALEEGGKEEASASRGVATLCGGFCERVCRLKK
jgi:hypothetical protein